MSYYDVYSRYPIELVKADGLMLWDCHGRRYLDLYGGHAVISIGHGHRLYRQNLKDQIDHIGFYSNSVKIALQDRLSEKLVAATNMKGYRLFMVNSGAEANENALKLTALHSGRKKFISFSGSFHGRTALTIALSDTPALKSAISGDFEIIRLPFNDTAALYEALSKENEIAAVIIESIQGLSGIHVASDDFLQTLSTLCKKHGIMLIADEIQCGFGRSGAFFAFQHADIKPDIITMAKGMGNGFPVGSLLIHPDIPLFANQLGTTFGGNQLACAASLSVLAVLEQENLIANARSMGDYLINELKKISGITCVRGRGLMIGIELGEKGAQSSVLRERLLQDFGIFTGTASHGCVIRLLPPLTLDRGNADYFLNCVQTICEELCDEAIPVDQ
ncbi:MAG: aspartate aminotransferase family protein [Francisellaceae bacterium]